MPCPKGFKKNQNKITKIAAEWRKKSAKYRKTHSYQAFVKARM